MHDDPTTSSLNCGQAAEPEGAEPAWVEHVLHFWFGEVSERHWWQQDDGVDAHIRQHFLPLHERLAAQSANSFTTPRMLLAAAIVLDQFSRHIFRRTPRAYATDPAARAIARSAIEQGIDSIFNADERQFLYLPFQHSEDAGDQQLSVHLFQKLGNPEWMRFAVEHKEIIDRYGRFPHRNCVLGRQSTAEEAELLKKKASWF